MYLSGTLITHSPLFLITCISSCISIHVLLFSIYCTTPLWKMTTISGRVLLRTVYTCVVKIPLRDAVPRHALRLHWCARLPSVASASPR